MLRLPSITVQSPHMLIACSPLLWLPGLISFPMTFTHIKTVTSPFFCYTSNIARLQNGKSLHLLNSDDTITELQTQ
ncbi:MAG: hypothetical protein J2P37_16155 [Ktedonobacteraceae bacterium]|nr:hypothetical protein [Ktedonobacteraceae bacterium]